MKNDIFYYLVKLSNDDLNSIDSILSKYFIKNFSHADKFNIYDISEECNVSRASVRRFCQKIGFKNFADMKNFIKKYDLSKVNKGYEDSKYRENLTKQIMAITSELDSRMDTDEVSKICNAISEADKFYLLVPSIENYISRNLKIGLAQCGKIIYSIENLQNEMNEITKKDVVLVISVAGNYASYISDVIYNINAQTILLTANRIDDFESVFSKVYYLSHLDQTFNAEVYRQYAIPYFINIIINHYKKVNWHQEK